LSRIDKIRKGRQIGRIPQQYGTAAISSQTIQAGKATIRPALGVNDGASTAQTGIPQKNSDIPSLFFYQANYRKV
jgi:hypothetical protein